MSRTTSRKIRRLTDIPAKALRGRRVLLRVDINVELTARGVRDTTRLEAIRPTVDHLVNVGAIVLMVAHLGRPAGRDMKYSLHALVAPLRRSIGRPIRFIDDPIYSSKIQNEIASVPSGHVALLENIRFEPGETKNDLRLAKRLASFCDLVVNDAFADSHRAHASLVGVASYRPMVAGCGLTIELDNLQRHLTKPAHPYVALIGGAKISTKLGLVKKLLANVDAICLGGALANTVLKAEGVAVGASLIEPSMIRAARGLHTTNRKIHIPIDVIVAGRGRPIRRAIGNVEPKERILDIGPDTVELFSRVCASARTIVWNGPMGVYEQRPFDRGTRAIARMMARGKRITIAGGGETVDAIKRQKLDSRFTFLSTGGGAMLEWLEGKTLPGVAACIGPAIHL